MSPSDNIISRIEATAFQIVEETVRPFYPLLSLFPILFVAEVCMGLIPPRLAGVGVRMRIVFTEESQEGERRGIRVLVLFRVEMATNDSYDATS